MKNIIQGKTCLITGANSGIGKALSLELAHLGARVIMICRNRERGELARQEIMKITQNPDIDMFLIDLSSQRSIKEGVIEIKRKYDELDILINNAGVLLFQRCLTEENIEKTMATNYFGPFLLTNLLLDLLIKSAPSRIINVVSEGQLKGEFDLAELTAPKKYKPMKVYSLSKQAEILFTYELAEKLREKNVTSNCFYPGLVKTNLGKPDRGFYKLTYNF